MYYAVIDEEFCNVVPGARRMSYPHNREIIQIGVVLLDENFDVIDTFSEYIRPEYGYVDGFIRNLTGITPYKVSRSKKLCDVLDQFKAWLPDDTIMVSWSKSDLNQLKKETETKNIDMLWLEDKYETWIDCQKEFGEKIQADKRYNLQEALNLSDISSDGSEHDGFSDAYNTAMLFKKIMTEKEFHTSSKYLKETEETDTISFSLGSLLSQIRIAS